MLNNRRNLAVGIAVLAISAAIGVAAVVHHRDSVPSTAYVAPAQPVADQSPADQTGASGQAQYTASAPQQSAAPDYQVDQTNGYYAYTPRPIYVQPAPVAPITAPAQVEGGNYYAPRAAYRTRYSYHRGRSRKHSLEIVAGSALTGAALGAIAGGPQGAAIGAVAGGVGGFAYDRATHNH